MTRMPRPDEKLVNLITAFLQESPRMTPPCQDDAIDGLLEYSRTLSDTQRISHMWTHKKANGKTIGLGSCCIPNRGYIFMRFFEVSADGETVSWGHPHTAVFMDTDQEYWTVVRTKIGHAAGLYKMVPDTHEEGVG